MDTRNKFQLMAASLVIGTGAVAFASPNVAPKSTNFAMTKHAASAKPMQYKSNGIFHAAHTKPALYMPWGQPVVAPKATAKPKPKAKPKRHAKKRGHKRKRFAAKKRARKQRLLKRFDRNGDGKLGPAERMAMKRTRFKTIDTDNSGTLTKAELMANKRKRMKKRHAKRAKRGVVPGKTGKFANKRQTKHKRMKKRFAKRFSRMDSNKDGVLSFKEFAANKRGKHHRRGRHHRGNHHRRGHRGQSL